MIAKISSGKSTGGLIRYLFDTKKATDHTDPHLVASWDGFAPDPGRTAEAPDVVRKQLVADLDLRVNQARRHGRAPERHVWHCSIRAARADRHLTDDEWSVIAHRVVAATSIAPVGDPDGCRWVAVRHAPDHIHIAATTVRADLRPARHWNDYLTADRELAAIEEEYGLFQVVRGDRTAAKRPTRAEQEKARRHGRTATPREHLRTTVRTMVAAARSTEEFLHLLGHADGVQVEVKHFPSGDIRGYTIAVTGDINQAGELVWFSGSELAPDLSFPKIKKRLDDLAPQTEEQSAGRRTNPWHQATAAVERIPHHLDGNVDDEAAQAHINALGEALDALSLIEPAPLQASLRQAATEFERAVRSLVQAEHQHARALRGAVRAILREPSPKDGAALAMFLDAALLATLAAARWHQHRHHNHQVAAVQRTQLQLQAVYDEAAVAPMAALARQRPPQLTVDRHIALVRDVVPDYAEKIVEDVSFDALTTTLVQAEEAGHIPEQILRTAVGRRALADAEHPARVLIWRIQRLAARPAPSPLARAAQARSIHGMGTRFTAPASVTTAAQQVRPEPIRRPKR
ncbi:mobilization protein [Streptomyces sp. NPDC059897]|uniref:mobilization protein n=1 Tax=Streptomyces sp. NPDC059897 TaxID=3346994 RepID=UPI0036627D0C